MHCAAMLRAGHTRDRCADGLAMQPLEFPGGNIGSLAVHGAVNFGPGQHHRQPARSVVALGHQLKCNGQNALRLPGTPKGLEACLA